MASEQSSPRAIKAHTSNRAVVALALTAFLAAFTGALTRADREDGNLREIKRYDLSPALAEYQMPETSSNSPLDISPDAKYLSI